MSKSIDIEEDMMFISISFPYQRNLVDVVRSLPQRRFDRESKAWYVPVAHLEQVVGRLHPHEFELSEALLEYCKKQGAALEVLVERARALHRPLIEESLLPKGTFTVATLNHKVRDVMRGAFRDALWLAAEVQSFDRRSNRGGHAFFELVHRPFVGADPIARVPAVIWSDDLSKIERVLHEDGGDVRLRDGLVVRLLVHADFYTGQGRYQVVASEIDLAYTTGTIHQRREAVLRRLFEADVLDKNLSLAWPIAPLRLGLITSDGSDAYMDFVHELERSGLGFEVHVHDASMQGMHTESSVLRALLAFRERKDEFDALAIVRGGGARSDLAYFDTDAIGQAVCNHPVKIIVGVGHQRDVCLLDMIAHSEKTPTAAAQFFVHRVREYLERQRHMEAHIVHCAQAIMHRANEDVRILSEHMVRAVTQRVDASARSVDRVSWAISGATRTRLEHEHRHFDRLGRQIPAAARSRTDVGRAHVEHAQRRMGWERLERVLERRAAILDRDKKRLERASRRSVQGVERLLHMYVKRLRLLDPERILERGFALVRGSKGLVRSSLDVECDEPLDILLAQGSLQVQVLHTIRGVAKEDKPTDVEQGEE